jgi:hypothetical protein
MSDATTKPAAKATQACFIHSALDERGLPASDFRVFATVARRGNCYASIATLARTCLLSQNTVRKSLRTLAEQRMISATQRTGQSTIYNAEPVEKWAPLPNETSGVKRKGTPTKRERSPLPKQTSPPLPNETRQSISPEVTPSEVTPIKGEDRPPDFSRMYPGEITREIKDLKEEIKRTKFEFQNRPMSDQDKADVLKLYERLRAFETHKYGSPRTGIWAKIKDTPDPNDRNRGTANEGRSSDYAGVGRMTGDERRRIGIGETPHHDLEALTERRQQMEKAYERAVVAEAQGDIARDANGDPITAAEMFRQLREQIRDAQTDPPKVLKVKSL